MRARSVTFVSGVVTAMLIGASLGADAPPQPKLSVMIVDGMNNHDWERATRILKTIFLDSGRFKVGVTTSPPVNAPSEEWQAWKPDFARYDVVVMNFNGGHTDKGVHWSRDLEKSLEDYVSGSGGGSWTPSAWRSMLGVSLGIAPGALDRLALCVGFRQASPTINLRLFGESCGWFSGFGTVQISILTRSCSALRSPDSHP
jgi:hypothetical protein